MKRAASFALIAAALAACAGAQRLKVGETPDGEVVEAVGETMADGDALATKKRSLVEAQKKAVEMVVGVRVTAKTLVEKAIEIESNILARTDGYVKKYDVLKEWDEPPFHKTKIRALVAYEQIEGDLKQLGLLKEPQVGNPRVAVLLTESSDLPDQTAPTEATNAFAQALLDKGYRVVDRADLMAAQGEAVAKEVSKGNVQNMASLGKNLDAEVLVFGNAKTSLLTTEGLGGLVSYRASLSGQAYKAQTNEVLVTFSRTASGLDATKDTASMKALRSVGQMAGGDAADKLAQELARRAFVAVTVTGIPDVNHLRDIERVVSAIPGVGDTYLRSYASGQAHLDVQMQHASSRDIASALERASDLKASVQDVTQDTVSVNLTK